MQSVADHSYSNGHISPSAKGSPPPPPPPAPSSQPHSSYPAAGLVKLKASDQIPFEQLRTSRAGLPLFTEGRTWRGPVHWSASKKKWRQYTPGSIVAPSASLSTFEVVIYNVLYGDSHMGQQRIAAQLSILQKTDADVICIAEATAEFLTALLAVDWAHKYHIADGPEARTFKHYDVLILSKMPFVELFMQELPTRRNRYLQIGVITLGEHRIAVACAHLDSPPRDRELRVAQVDAAFKALARVKADAMLLAGDFNYADNTCETRFVEEHYKQWHDAWRDVHPQDPGITFSVSKNDLAVALFPGEIDKRLDRVLYCSDYLQGTEASLLGTEPIIDANGKHVAFTLKGESLQHGLFPSDHFGVQFKLTIAAGATNKADEHCTVC